MWRLSPIGYVPNMNENSSVLAWFDNVIANKLTLLTMILWRIWKCRNVNIFNGENVEPQLAMYMAVRDAEEFVKASWEVEAGANDRDQAEMMRFAGGRFRGLAFLSLMWMENGKLWRILGKWLVQVWWSGILMVTL